MVTNLNWDFFPNSKSLEAKIIKTVPALDVRLFGMGRRPFDLPH